MAKKDPYLAHEHIAQQRMKKGRLRKEDGPVQFLNWIGLKIGFCIFRIDDIAVGIRVDGVGARFDARILFAAEAVKCTVGRHLE